MDSKESQLSEGARPRYGLVVAVLVALSCMGMLWGGIYVLLICVSQGLVVIGVAVLAVAIWGVAGAALYGIAPMLIGRHQAEETPGQTAQLDSTISSGGRQLSSR